MVGRCSGIVLFKRVNQLKENTNTPLSSRPAHSSTGALLWSHDGQAVFLEENPGEWLGQDIGLIILRGYISRHHNLIIGPVSNIALGKTEVLRHRVVDS
jgi:hypothetical protein